MQKNRKTLNTDLTLQKNLNKFASRQNVLYHLGVTIHSSIFTLLKHLTLTDFCTSSSSSLRLEISTLKNYSVITGHQKILLVNPGKKKQNL